MIINGKSILLRPVCFGDMELFRNWWSDIELMRHFDQLPPLTYNQIEQEFRKNLNAGNRIDFIIEDKAQLPIGTIYLKNINWKDRNAELHTLIAGEAYRNLGFGIEAQYYVLQYAFNEINMHKMYGRVLEYARDNIKLMEFVGYKKEVICKKAVFHNGRYWDLYIFGLLKREFDSFLKQDGKNFIEYADVT